LVEILGHGVPRILRAKASIAGFQHGKRFVEAVSHRMMPEFQKIAQIGKERSG
jgi:hypothetical protein